MRTFLLSLLFCLNISSGHCEEISAFEVDPHAIVAGHVDATSGAWREEENDFFVPSRIPFTLRRYYSSQWGEWRFFPHCSLIQGSSSSATSVIFTFESNGTPLRFTKTESQKHYHCSVSGQNTAHGSISPGTNYANFACEGDEKRILLTHPDGTVRMYEKVQSSDLGPLCVPFLALQNKESLQNVSCFRLVSETFPVKASILYSYDDDGRLSSLELVHDPKQEGKKLVFSYAKNVIHASLDGKKMVSYSFVDGKLDRVDRIAMPSVSYAYQDKLLIRKDYPQNRFQTLTYDKSGRVSALFGPFSKHEIGSVSNEPLYTFHYRDGMTQVISVQGHKICFYHAKGLLQTVELQNKNGLYRTDRFVWNCDNSVSKLLGHTTHAKDGTTLWATTNEYAEGGSLSQSKFFSVATEYPEHAIQIDSNGLAFGEPESETPEFLHKGPFGVISKQNDGSGNLVEYTYKDGTTLVSERYERNQNECKRRSFYVYDNVTHALVKEIHDNGREKGVDKLNGVRDRTILEIQPRKYPKAGLDEEIITQKYSNEYKRDLLVGRLKLFYDKDNNLVRKELYDTNNAIAKAEEYSYDDHGNCIRSINALGEVVLRTYDENDNCIRVEECSSGRITTVEYDLNNYPTTTTTVYADGHFVTTTSVHDSFGNKVAFVDRLGNRTDYGYDEFSRLISITHPQVLDEGGNPIRPQETFAYDIFNNIVLKTDSKGYAERYRYTSSGKLLRTDYPDGTYEQYEYLGEKIKTVTNRDETNTRYRYDLDMRLAAVETFAQNNQDCIFQQKFEYSPRNLCRETQRPNGGFVFREYDHFGRVISEEENRVTTSGRSDFDDSKTQYEYDTLHRPQRIKRWIDSKNFIVECLRYDALDRVVEKWIEEPDHTKSHHVVNASPFRDLVPYFDLSGLRMARKQKTVKEVKSHPSDPFLNHSFQNETYKQDTHDTIQRYLDIGN